MLNFYLKGDDLIIPEYSDVYKSDWKIIQEK